MTQTKLKFTGKLKHIISNIFNEFLIVFLLVFLINNFIGNVEDRFIGDGGGYYDYLPSLFIYHDLNRKDIPLSGDNGIYDRIGRMGVYTRYKDGMVNKYACGTAVLELPFFIFTYLTKGTEGTESDGFQPPFQRSVYHAALFYVFLSLMFLKKLLKTYRIRPGIITLCQLLMVLATPVTIYASKEASFSHVYSMFAITAFLYFARLYFMQRKYRDLILASLLLGLIVILRQINLLIVLFIPFLAGSSDDLVAGWKRLVSKPKVMVLAMTCILAVFSIQSVLWYLQTGDFLLYSYPGQRFNFLDPKFFNILFSYRKGLFVYTPVLFIASLSILWFLYQKKYYLVFTWLGFFIFITFLFSSWWSWYFGASYGLRAYIDFFAIFFIPLALVLNESARVKYAIITLTLLTIPMNIIQSHQYRNYILHNFMMDREKYWLVFLRTHPKFRGLLYNTPVEIGDYHQSDEFGVGDYTVRPGTNETFYTCLIPRSERFQDISLIRVSLMNDFRRQDDTRLVLVIRDEENGKTLRSHEKYLIHFAHDGLNKQQIGTYDYILKPAMDLRNKTILLGCESGNQPTELRHITIRFFRE